MELDAGLRRYDDSLVAPLKPKPLGLSCAYPQFTAALV